MLTPTPEFPRFLAPVPDDLQQEIDRSAVLGGTQLELRDWNRAFDTFATLNNTMVARQPPGRRFHKGMPLHNMGLARLLGQRPEEGLQFTLDAFAEDALSAGDERLPEGEELRRPAAQNLLAVFGFPPELVREVGVRIRDLGAVELFPVPHPAIAAAGITIQVNPPAVPPVRVVGQFGSRWAERVFVGGAYRLFANLSEIKRICVGRGFDAVMATDFDIPRELIHHHALLLLHECRLAIFEISVEAGQLMELERTRDYEIAPADVLVLNQAAPGHTAHVSGMVEALLSRLAISPISYASLQDLPGIIEPWLEARRI